MQHKKLAQIYGNEGLKVQNFESPANILCSLFNVSTLLYTGADSAAFFFCCLSLISRISLSNSRLARIYSQLPSYSLSTLFWKFDLVKISLALPSGDKGVKELESQYSLGHLLLHAGSWACCHIFHPLHRRSLSLRLSNRNSWTKSAF